MKVVVISSPKNTNAAQNLMTCLEKNNIDVCGVKFNKNWRDEKQGILENKLSEISHVICIVDDETENEAWFSYIVGFSFGKSVPFSLYVADPNWQNQEWIQNEKVFTSIDELVPYYLEEQEEWSKIVEKKMAKAALLELGISWHSESFMHCIEEGDTKAVKLFLDSGFSANSRDKNGVPALNFATRSKHLSVVELLVENGANIDVQSDDRGYSALMDAVQLNDINILEYLLGKGAEPNLVSKDGQTALIIAVGRNDALMVNMLMKYNADADIVDKLGLSARKYAKMFNKADIIAAIEGVEQNQPSV